MRENSSNTALFWPIFHDIQRITTHHPNHGVITGSDQLNSLKNKELGAPDARKQLEYSPFLANFPRHSTKNYASSARPSAYIAA